MKFKEAIKAFQFNKDTRFILTGSEPFIKEFFVKKAEEMFPDYEFSTFYPDSQEEALDVINSGTLFGNRVVILKYFDYYTGFKNFEKSIKQSSEKIIIILSERANLKKSNATHTISLGTQVTCNKLREYGNDYPSWIVSQASEAGYSMRDDAEYFLYNLVGSSMFTLSNELYKLYLYKNEDKYIYPVDVQEVTSWTSVSNYYEILESILKKDIKKCLRSFEAYYKAHNTLSELSFFLSVYMEKLYRIALLREQRMSVEDIAEIIGLPKFIISTKYLPRVLSLGKQGVAEYIDRVAQLDIQLRKFRGSKKVLVESFLLGFAA